MKTLHEIKNTGELIDEKAIKGDLPMILLLKRKAVRLFPSGERVALYHSDKLGIDVSIPYSHDKDGPGSISGIATNEEVINESEHDDMFGDYTEALKKHYETGSIHTDHPELSKLKAKIIHKYGKEAHSHLHKAAEHYLNGDIGKASRHFAKFERKINENYEEFLDEDFVSEATIHKLHLITKTKQDGEVVFANGARHKISHAQAAHIMKLHTLMTPENKATIEKHLNSPEGLTKVADFASTNLK
jgi:hypothetical protein